MGARPKVHLSKVYIHLKPAFRDNLNLNNTVTEEHIFPKHNFRVTISFNRKTLTVNTYKAFRYY